MGVAAAREAIAASGLDLASEDPSRIGVILGGGTSGLIDSEAFFELYLRGRKARPSKVLNHLPDSITDRVAQRFGLEGIKSTITTACSSSANALGYAFDAISAGLADVVVTGGSDVLARLTYGGFNSLRSVDPNPPASSSSKRRGAPAAAERPSSRSSAVTA
jgi:3-oxoacyl-[acyl-carrier-protein] synthase II